MLERLLIGLAAELILKLVEKYAKDPVFRAAVDAAMVKIQAAKTIEEKKNASKSVQDAMG